MPAQPGCEAGKAKIDQQTAGLCLGPVQRSWLHSALAEALDGSSARADVGALWRQERARKRKQASKKEQQKRQPASATVIKDFDDEDDDDFEDEDDED